MPRLPRNYFQTSFYHVISQGIEKIFIFNDNNEINKYISFMKKLNVEYFVKIIAYCIMNNHAHLLLEVNNVTNLSAYMHRLNTKYAQYYNKKHNRVGFVFRNRFKSEGILSEEYLYNCINYIFYNPVKAGICNHPKEYPYSNYNEYIEKNGEIFQLQEEYNNFLEYEEDKEEKCIQIVNNFLQDKNRDMIQVSRNIEIIKELVTILKKNNISLLLMEKITGINRKKIKKILEDENIISL